MGLFDSIFASNDKRLIDAYERAYREAGRGFVDPRRFPYLDRELAVYAKENDCSYEEAFIYAKTGKKTGSLSK